jgi:hypothetical protein
MTNEQFEALVSQDAARLVNQGVIQWEREEALRDRYTDDYGVVDSAGIYHEFEEIEEWSEFDE